MGFLEQQKDPAREQQISHLWLFFTFIHYLSSHFFIPSFVIFLTFFFRICSSFIFQYSYHAFRRDMSCLYSHYFGYQNYLHVIHFFSYYQTFSFYKPSSASFYPLIALFVNTFTFCIFSISCVFYFSVTSCFHVIECFIGSVFIRPCWCDFYSYLYFRFNQNQGTNKL